MNLLEKTEALFHSARKSFIEAVAHLYACQRDEAWKEKYSTFGEFVETLGLSQSSASKMLSVYTHFVLEGGVSHAKASEVDLERLYLASKLQGTPEEQIEKASLLTRQEIKAQRTYETTGVEHEHQPITICKICDKRLS